MSIPRLAVVGLGLIGGSILRGAAERGLARDLAGWDPSPAAREAVRRAGLGAGLAPSLAEAARGASLVVVAAPVRAIPAAVDAARRAAGPGAAVTDTGSVKGWVLAEVERLARAGAELSPSGGGELSPFVGGHPIAGSHASGFAAADGNLFEGQPWAIVPGEARGGEGATARAAEQVVALARGLGAEPFVTGATVHDETLALTSHLPYLLAVALTTLAAARPRAGAGPGAPDPADLAPFVASGFRDATRLALQDPAMGLDILSTNVANLEAVLARLAERSAGLLAALGTDGGEGRASFEPPDPGEGRPPLESLAWAREFRERLGRVKRW